MYKYTIQLKQKINLQTAEILRKYKNYLKY